MQKTIQFRTLPGCIFCGNLLLTQEHIYADWLYPYLTKSYPRTRHEFNIRTNINGPIIEGANIKNGNPTTKKIKCVCQTCNGGWMSALQSEVKPILLELLNGNWNRSTTAQQLTLSAWITMFVMVLEYRHMPSVAITQTERTKFFKTKMPLPNFNIWACGFDPIAGNLVTWHKSLFTYKDNEIPTDNLI